VAFSFVNDTLLLATFGMAGATGNCYAGLYEFEDMALIAHVLRPGELFVDVGANIGAYTILAGSVGARCLSIEAIPTTFAHLQRNVNLNGLQHLVSLQNVAAGASEGVLRFLRDFDSTNRVATPDEPDAIEITVRTLDQLLGQDRPVALKIDVEGFETAVIEGARAALTARSLQVLLVERNGHGARYGFDEDALHRSILAAGFTVCRYRPFERLVVPTGPNAAAPSDGNTLYVRDLTRVQSLVTAAPAIRVHGWQL
jgi:FkbM family methyltransferase